MSTTVPIHHNTASIPTRGLVIYEPSEGTEPKTLLEIGGVTRPNPTYLTSSSLLQNRISGGSAIITSHQSPYTWINDDNQEMMPAFIPYTELQEHKLMRFSSGSWNLADRTYIKSYTSLSPDKGKFSCILFCNVFRFSFLEP